MIADILQWLVSGQEWSGSSGILARLIEHIWYTLLVIVLASLIAVPAGLWIGHTGRGRWMVTVANALRAIPTLGLLFALTLVLLPHLPGSAAFIVPSIAVLVLLAVPPILSGTYSGVESTDPVALDAAGIEVVAEFLARGGPRYASFFGPAAPVLGLWERLRETWSAPFDVRPEQPLLALDRPPAPELLGGPARHVRWAAPHEFSRVLPAAVAMFTEEVGYSPLTDGAEGYRQRVRQLLRDRRTTVLTDERGEVVFKADVGSVSRGVCQVQGVWVRPEDRGRGLAVPCMAATVALARTVAPVVSLYVNSFNAPALATYRRVGFERHGEFATVLL